MTTTLITTEEHTLLRKIGAGELIQTLSTNAYFWAEGPRGTPAPVSRPTSNELARLTSAGLVRLGESFVYRFGLNNIRVAALTLTVRGRHAVTAHPKTA